VLEPFVPKSPAAAPKRHQESLALIGDAQNDRRYAVFDITDQPLRVKQFRPVLPASRRDLQRRPEQVQFSHEGSSRLESMEQGAARTNGQPGKLCERYGGGGHAVWCDLVSSDQGILPVAVQRKS